MPTYRKVTEAEQLERVAISDVRVGDELVDRFRISLGVVATKPVVSPLGSVTFFIQGSPQVRYLSPWSPPGKNGGTVLRIKKES